MRKKITRSIWWPTDLIVETTFVSHRVNSDENLKKPTISMLGSIGDQIKKINYCQRQVGAVISSEKKSIEINIEETSQVGFYELAIKHIEGTESYWNATCVEFENSIRLYIEINNEKIYKETIEALKNCNNDVETTVRFLIGNIWVDEEGNTFAFDEEKYEARNVEIDFSSFYGEGIKDRRKLANGVGLIRNDVNRAVSLVEVSGDKDPFIEEKTEEIVSAIEELKGEISSLESSIGSIGSSVSDVPNISDEMIHVQQKIKTVSIILALNLVVLFLIFLK